MADHAPVFIQGIEGRSGTNLLAHLLRLHPACGGPEGWPEDRFLMAARPLEAFARTLEGVYPTDWELGPRVRSEILPALGDALVGLLQRDCPAPCVVTKSPGFANLALFPALFPRSRLILLLRDGRDQVDSRIHSFGGDFAEAAHQWGRAAREYLDFVERFAGAGFHHTVRFEALQSDRRATLEALFRFLGLDAGAYDFGAAGHVPVLGSSRAGTGGTPETFRWRIVEPPDGFQPVGRWRQWPEAQRGAFREIAGEELARLGYAWG